MSKENDDGNKVQSLEGEVIKFHAHFLEAIKDTYPLAVLGSLCIAIAAFTKTTAPSSSDYAALSATLFIIAFVLSLMGKFIPDLVNLLLSYLFTSVGIVTLLLVVHEFSVYSPTIYMGVSLVMFVTLFIMVLIFMLYYRRITRRIFKSGIIRLIGHLLTGFGALFDALLVIFMCVYTFKISTPLLLPFIYILIFSLMGFSISALVIGVLTITYWFKVKKGQKPKDP
jgi:hypothetical protein